MAVKRGKIAPEACRDCGAKAVPHHPNPEERLTVIWLCPSHRAQQRQREAEQKQHSQERQQHERSARAWQALRARFATEFPQLPATLQDELRQQAQSDPLARNLHPEAPLARQALIRAFGRLYP